MEHFQFQLNQWHCESVPLAELARQYGTPLFVYSQRAILDNLSAIQSAFRTADPLICYSLKSNPNIHLGRLMAEHGAGFDVTSGGELFRALQAGGTGPKIVFAGVGKTDDELRLGLESKVVLFNVESDAELFALADVAQRMNRVAPVALRVNPALPPKTHVKTDTSVRGTKFGLDIDSILEIAKLAVGHRHLAIVGLHMHLGSPILSSKPYHEGAEKGVALIDELRKQGHDIQFLNMGGGFGISYRNHEALPAQAFADAILPAVNATRCRLVLEPGRFIVGNAGLLVSRVIYTKKSGGRNFIIQDGGMNDLIRPTLYDAFHRIWPVHVAPPADYETESAGTRLTDVVGPVCETGDFLAKDRWLPAATRGDFLAIFSAGAYGMSMSSNYNSRLRAAEVLVDGANHRLIRRRETYEDLVRPEILP